MRAQTQPSAPPAARLAERAGGLTLEHLWLASLLALIWLFISILPLPPNDLWWHMAAGRASLAEGALIDTNRWSYTLPADTPFFYQSWLSELALYGLWRLGDVPLLTLARTLVIVLSYGLLGWHALRRTAQGRAVAAALLLVVLAGWDNWTLRPQTLALLPAAAFVALLGEYQGGRAGVRWLAALPALMLVWVNTHGSFVLGVGLLGLALLGALLDALPRGAPEAAEARGRLLPLAAALLATGLAVLANPRGPGIVGYVSGLTSNPAVQKWILEWQPPRSTFNMLDPGFWFYVLLLLIALLMARAPRRPSTTDLLWYAGTAWLAIGAVRNVMWFGLVMLPLLSDLIAQRMRARPPVRLPGAFAACFGLLIGAGMVATLPWLTPARYLGPGGAKLFAEAGPHGLLLSSTTPVGAGEWLAEHPTPGRFWTDMSYASYTTWRLPERQIFTDMRIELFPEPVWLDYFDISAGGERSLALLDKWEITHLLISRTWQKELSARLAATPGWCLRYQDERSQVFERCR
jgi:hypothetical protein